MFLLYLPKALFPVGVFFLIVIPELILAVAPETTNTNVLIATTIVGFMTMVVQQGFSAYNLRKTHRDDIEDREAKAKQLAEAYKAENEKMQHLTELRAQEVRLLVEQRQLELVKEQSAHLETMKALFVKQSDEAQQRDTNLAELQKTTKDGMDEKLDQIHVLVNSNMTLALQNELDARRVGLTLLEETITLKRTLGVEPTNDVKATLLDAKMKIVELEAKLRDRTNLPPTENNA